MPTYKGVLFLFSETGTEGGYWALQDEEFITKATGDPVNKHCQRCGRWWGDAATTPEPAPSFTYFRDDWEADGKRYIGGYYGSDVPIEGGQTWFRGEEPGSFNDEWTKKNNATSLACYESEHVWEWVEPTDSWSYEGLRTLQDGDVLTVLNDDGTEKFKTTVKLIQQYDQYAETAKSAGGWVIHSYPDPEVFPDFDLWCDVFNHETRGILERSDG